MATDRHQAPSYPLRMPEALKARIQASANESGRSLHAELLYRLERSYEMPAGDLVSLAPTVVRMERDLAKLEVDRMQEVVLARVVVSTLKALLSKLPENEIVEGPLGDTSAADWTRICEGLLAGQKLTQPEVQDAYARLEKAELKLQALYPLSQNSLMDQMKALRQVDPEKLSSPKKHRPLKPKL